MERLSHPRFSDSDGTATSPFEWLRAADELDSRTGSSEHDGSAGHQGAPSRAEWE